MHPISHKHSKKVWYFGSTFHFKPQWLLMTLQLKQLCWGMMIFRKLLIFKVTHILVNISQGPLRISPKFQVQSSRGKLCILAPTTKMGRILTEKSKLGGSVPSFLPLCSCPIKNSPHCAPACHWCSYNRPYWNWGGTDDHTTLQNKILVTQTFFFC